MRDLAALRELALAHSGAFTTAEAAACGWNRRDVERALAAGEWTRLHPGVFVDAGWFAGLEPAARHLTRVRARLRFRADGWHAARRSAAVVHGLPLIGKPPAVAQLVRDKESRSLRGHARHERIASLHVEDRTEVEGVPVTSMARTVVDVAREEPFRNGVAVADAALRRGLTTEELERVLARCTGWPGSRAARRVARFADARAETPLESISRVAFETLHVPAPELQVEVWDNGCFVARVDFLWRDHHVVGEADGKAKYVTVSDLYAEKRREERLRDLGFEVVRWDWATAYRPGPGFAETLQRALSRGALNTLATGVRLLPAVPARAAA